MTETPTEDGSRPPSNNGMKGTVEFLGVITAIIGILAWLGIANWQELKDWANDRGHSSSSTTTPTPPTSRAQVSEEVKESTVGRRDVALPKTKTVDRGCDAALATLEVFDAVPFPEALSDFTSHARAYADALDRAADQSDDREVVSAVIALAIDWRLLATYLDNNDFDSAQALTNKLVDDAIAVRAAC
ncbi:hypothetical protein [Pseudonocardia yunnanensis]|uniref:Uncharacterized protein n=1 Tax=Pseudonocardia yunnanensis TaxID=58107 RepID=A0ABW4EWT3_9PSEU